MKGKLRIREGEKEKLRNDERPRSKMHSDLVKERLKQISKINEMREIQ